MAIYLKEGDAGSRQFDPNWSRKRLPYGYGNLGLEEVIARGYCHQVLTADRDRFAHDLALDRSGTGFSAQADVLGANAECDISGERSCQRDWRGEERRNKGK